MTHKKTLLFSLIPFAALLLMAASGNLRWDQFRAADKHGTGSYGQSSDGTGASGDIAAFNADGTITDGGAASGLLSGSTNPGIPVSPTVRQTQVSSSHTGSGGNYSSSFTSPVVAGNTILVAGLCDNNPIAGTMTDSRGSVYASIMTVSTNIVVYKATAAASGTDTITINGSAGWCGDMSMAMVEVANTNGTVDISNSGAASTGPPAVTTTKYGDTLILLSVAQYGSAYAAAPPSVLLQSQTTTPGAAAGYMPTTSAGTYTPSLTLSSGSNGAGFTIAMGPVPVTSPGVVGNFYINTSTGALWGPKSSSGWNTLGDSLIPEATSPSNIRGLTFTFDGGGSALSAGKVVYLRTPFACTIVSWSIASTTAETDTVALWRVATGGTALPTSSNSISTAGVSLTSGTAAYSTTLTDFTSTAIAANDWLAASLTAVTASHFVNYTLGCQQ